MNKIKLTSILLILLLSLYFLAMPDMYKLQKQNPTQTEFMALYKKEQKLTVQIWLDYQKISLNLKKAVLVSEDDTFFKHNGFNWAEIKKAIWLNWEKKAFKRGASTLTQQLVKNLYLGPQKTILRKLREMILTYQMEKTLSKERIFELYLNLVEWGPGIFGAEAAAQHYFHRSANSLSMNEAAWLAAILPNPNRLSSSKYSRHAHKRAGLILRRMSRYPIDGIGIQTKEKSSTIPALEIPENASLSKEDFSDEEKKELEEIIEQGEENYIPGW